MKKQKANAINLFYETQEISGGQFFYGEIILKTKNIYFVFDLLFC